MRAAERVALARLRSEGECAPSKRILAAYEALERWGFAQAVDGVFSLTEDGLEEAEAQAELRVSVAAQVHHQVAELLDQAGEAGMKFCDLQRKIGRNRQYIYRALHALNAKKHGVARHTRWRLPKAA